MFIGFDLEEVGLFGSRYFVAHPPVPLDRIALFVTADMIGRSLAGVCDPHVFVMGTEHAPGCGPGSSQAARGGRSPSACSAPTWSSIAAITARSARRKVPFLFFTTGENPAITRPRTPPRRSTTPS